MAKNDYYGCMGKILWVDLSARTFNDQHIEHGIYRQYLTGYGLAARVLFENKVYAADPLGGENVFAVMSGLLTNTGAFFSGRWMVAGKSPLTGGWGDANCGGYFAPAIKKAGYDGIFFKGIAKNPVYLYIGPDEDGKMVKELRDADPVSPEEKIWGRDTYETEDILRRRHGPDCKVACIGKGGENQSLIAGVVTDKGRAAARSGLGAVMGSKKLKAICLDGREATGIYDVVRVSTATGNFMNDIGATQKDDWKNRLVSWFALKPAFAWLVRLLSSCGWLSKLEPADFNWYSMKRWGTCSTTAFSANTGDSPVKNWKGVGLADFDASRAIEISNDAVTDHEFTKYGCHHCPLRCGGKMNMPKPGGSYPACKDDKEIKETHKIEYETSCGFGTLLLCNDLATIVEIHDMLNRAGIDTISCAVVVAWAFEAYERGVITKEMAGMELNWADAAAAKQLVKKIINNEGIGAHLKDGVKRAVEHFGGGDFAMHAGGQELPMHDPRQKGGTGLGVQYETEPTPGRHTSTCDGCDMYRSGGDSKNKKVQRLKGQLMKLKVPGKTASENASTDVVGGHAEEAPDAKSLADASSMADMVNGLGMCLDAFGLMPTPPPLLDWLNGATGWKHPDGREFEFDDYLEMGRRIKTVRHSFNVMAKITLADTRMPDRARGYKLDGKKKVPVLTEGPNARRIPDIDTGNRNYYLGMGYDPETGKPSKETLDELNLGYVKEVLYPD